MGDISPLAPNIPTRMMVLASLMILVLLLMMLYTITHATMQQNLAAFKNNLSMINCFNKKSRALCKIQRVAHQSIGDYMRNGKIEKAKRFFPVIVICSWYSLIEADERQLENGK